MMIFTQSGISFAANNNGASGDVSISDDPEVKPDDVKIQQLIDLDEGTIPVESFFKNPKRAAYRISPNGKYIAYLAPYESRLNIYVQEIGSDKSVRLTEEKDRDIQGLFWANDDRLVYIRDFVGDENYHIYAVNKDGSNLKDLTPFENVRAQVIDQLRDIDHEMIVGLNKNNPMLHEPYRLDLNTGELTQLAENNDPMNPIAGWVTDHEGKLRLAIKVSGGTNTTILHRPTEESEWEEVLTTDFKVSVQPLFFTFDNKNLYASSNLDRDKQAIVVFDLSTGKETEVLYENPVYDVDGLNYSRKRKVLTTVSYTSWKQERAFLDPEAKEIYGDLAGQLGNVEIVLTGADDAEENYIVRTYSDRSLGNYYLYNKTSKKLDLLAKVNEDIDEEQMVEMKPIQYTSRDGLTIHGYLSLPKGVEHKNLPVVVNPHGGPWHRDVWAFNPEVQLLCNRGFAVLQMNFRGSTGYGREFWESSFKQWGRTMQNDITDGVNWLIDEGIADPERIAIYGGSYGGYATLAGVTYTPDLYTCAIDYVGVSNLLTFLNTIPPYWKPYLDMMYEMVGDPNTELEEMKDASPVNHVDKIKVPLFVVQGANDPRVNIAESDQIVQALRERDLDVIYMVKYNEGHGFANEENRFEFYKAMCGFLIKHMN